MQNHGYKFQINSNANNATSNNMQKTKMYASNQSNPSPSSQATQNINFVPNFNAPHAKTPQPQLQIPSNANPNTKLGQIPNAAPHEGITKSPPNLYESKSNLY